MPVFLVTFGKWIWALPAGVKIAIALVLLAATIAGYIAWQRHTIKNLEGELNQSEVNGAMYEVNSLTNKIEEEKRQDANLANIANQAERDAANVARRDSNSFTGDYDLQFCKRYCWDSSCARYRLVYECR